MQIYERLYRTPCALNTTQGTAAVWCTDVEKDLPLGEATGRQQPSMSPVSDRQASLHSLHHTAPDSPYCA